VAVKDAGGDCRIEIPFANHRLNERLTLAVPASDILLATRELQAVSARNILRGQIVAIAEKGNHTEIGVKSGVLWSVNVTRQAVNELQLSVSQEVWLAIKTHSCLLLDE
jgi:molybdopterin-binding protein